MVKILDLGLALRQTRDDSESSATLTKEGAVMGTPDYLAPEQARESHDVDIRADLYSLGCTFYYLLAGRAPFAGATLTQKLLAHQIDEPVPVETLRPEVPATVGAVVRRLMAKRPEDRYQTPAELAAVLAQMQRGQGSGVRGQEKGVSSLTPDPAPISPLAPPGRGVPTSPLAPPGRGVGGEGSAAEASSDTTAQVKKEWAAIAGPPVGLSPDTPSPRRVLLAVAIAVLVVLALTIGIVALFVTRSEKPQEDSFAKKKTTHIQRVSVQPEKKTPDPARPVTEEWIQAVQKMPAEEQVKAVAKKLQELNPEFDGKETHKIENGVVTELQFLTDNVTDISPVRALTELRTLDCRGNIGKGKLADLWPLKGMKLTTLHCPYTQVADLSALKGLKLTKLYSNNTQIADLSPLKDMDLTNLNCGATKVTDLSPLKNMKLTSLGCNNTQIADLSPLKDIKLTHLNCSATKITDLSPLKGMPLQKLNGPFELWRDTEILRSIKSLVTINGQPAAEFWKEVDAQLAALDAWCQAVAKLPPAEQVKAVAAKLKDLNPGFDGQVKDKIDKEVLTELQFLTDNVTDISPVRALKGLQILGCSGSARGKGKLFDLSPLKGISLTTLRCHNNQISDPSYSTWRELPSGLRSWVGKDESLA